MPNRNHLRIIADKQLEESGAVRFNYGFGDIENDREPDYFFMAQGFRENLNKYRDDLEAKIAVKDQNIEVPYDIDYIEIDFLGQFNIEKFLYNLVQHFWIRRCKF